MPRSNIILNEECGKYSLKVRRSIRMCSIATSCQNCIEGPR